MWSKRFWADAAERAIKTFAQAAVAVLSSGALGVLNVQWLEVVSVSGLAAVVSVLTSVASAGVGSRDTASLVNEPPV